MSKLGKKPIILKEGVTVKAEGENLVFSGSLGQFVLTLPDGIKVDLGTNDLTIKRLRDDKKTKSNHGTYSRLISNAIAGVSVGFSKTLEVVGTGFRAQMEGNDLVLALGFSHPVRYTAPEGVKIETQENKIKVSGIDKQMVGLVSDKIKKFRKPDPYRGKGIRYLGEKLRLKPGKTAAKAGAAGGK